MSPFRLRVVPAIANLADVPDAAWRTSGAFSVPRKVAAERRADPRWRREFAVAFDGEVPAGVITLDQPRNGRAADPTYDLRALGFPDRCREFITAERPVYIGGHQDFGTGWAVHSRVPEAEAGKLAADLIAFAVQHALRRGDVAVALYVREAEAPSFRTGFGPRAQELPMAEEAVLRVDDQDFDGYTAALPASHRAIVRRDLRRFARAGLSSGVRPARELIELAGPLVAAVKIRHGLADHPQLAAFRLESWMRDCPGEHVAFPVTDKSGQLLCVSFACGYQDILVVYEVGMAGAGGPDQHLAYLHALIYSPVMYALRHRHPVIRLGLAVGPAKLLRGAVAAPMRAFIATCGERGG